MIAKPRITVATIVERDGRFLFVEERIRREHVLNQPSGHLERDESLVDAAVRETREESGCEVQVDDLVGIYQWSAPDTGKQFVRFTFAATLLHHHTGAPLDAGIVCAHWLTRQELAANPLPLRSPNVLQSLDAWAQGDRYPLSLLHGDAS